MFLTPGSRSRPRLQWPRPGTPIPGQCQLTNVSSSQVTLLPYNGQFITCGSNFYEVPSQGVTAYTSAAYVDNVLTTLASSTLYYTYVKPWSNGLRLDFSTTGYVASAIPANVGVRQKTGDGSATLVGMTRTSSVGAFADSITQRFTKSWFNPRPATTLNKFTAARSTSATTLAEINSEIRCEFLAWSNEAVIGSITCNVTQTASASGVVTNVTFDGTTGSSFDQSVAEAFAAAGARAPQSPVYSTVLSEGYHYATLFGRALATGGTAGWTINSYLTVGLTE